MLVIFQPDAIPEEVARVEEVASEAGLTIRRVEGPGQVVIVLEGPEGALLSTPFQGLEGVGKVVRLTVPYPLARGREVGRLPVEVGPVPVGGGPPVVIAGPCAVEGRDQLLSTATAVASHGASILRGGTFKPRTSPYAFQGLGEEGLRILAEARDRTGLPFVTEAADAESVSLLEEWADGIQVGARNMQNFPLLRRVGRSSRPVLLKRGFSATLEELLLSAEYILSGGNEKVILCERGIRTFARHARNTLDLSAVPALQERTHLPVVVDPSHAMGRRDWVTPMALAAIAAGADGVMVEVHTDPERALSDGPQSLFPEQFSRLMDQVRKVASALGRG